MLRVRQMVMLMLIFALGAATSACGAPATSRQTTRIGNLTVTAGTRIPSSTVRFAYYPCCSDLGLPAIAMKLGYFKDVNINITPPGGYLYPSPDGILPSMQRGSQDITTFPDAGYLSTLNTFGESIPPVLMYSTYIGYGILAAPGTGAKTVTQFMKEGMTFAQAAKDAIAQMRGHTVYISPSAETQPPYAETLMKYDNLSFANVKPIYLIDNKMVELSATPGRLNWAIPYGGPFFVQLEQDGYRPILTVQDVLKYDPRSIEAKTEAQYVGDASVVVQRTFITQHLDTVLRFASVIFRTVASLEAPSSREKDWTIVADVINATQGTHLTAAEVGGLYQSIDPLFTWQDQRNLWVNSASPYYVPSAIRAQVASLIKSKTLPPGNYNLQGFLVGDTIYHDLLSLQLEAQSLFKQAKQGGAVNVALEAKAKVYYADYDFLDAVRLMKAAIS